MGEGGSRIILDGITQSENHVPETKVVNYVTCMHTHTCGDRYGLRFKSTVREDQGFDGMRSTEHITEFFNHVCSQLTILLNYTFKEIVVSERAHHW